MTLRDLSKKELRDGINNNTIVLEKFYAKFKCKKCRRTWTSHRYCRFRRGGDILSMPLACNKCGQKTHPSLIYPVSNEVTVGKYYRCLSNHWNYHFRRGAVEAAVDQESIHFEAVLRVKFLENTVETSD